MRTWQMLPGSMPTIMAGLRLRLGRAVSGIVILELLLVAVGFGRLIMRYQADFESAHGYAVVLIVVAEAVILMQLVKALERRFGPWRDVVVE